MVVLTGPKLVLGNYGAKNFGDELVLKGILEIVGGEGVTVLSADPKETEEMHNVKAGYVFPTGLRSLLKGGLLKTLKLYKQANIVIFGGGTLFTSEQPKTIWISGLQILPAIIMRKKIHCFRQGIGPINQARIVRWVFNKFEKIEVRDEESKRNLEKIGVKKEITVLPDPVFEMKMPRAEGDELLISLRKWDGVDEQFMTNLDQVLKKLDIKKRFISFEPEDATLGEKLGVDVTEVTIENYEEVFSRAGASINMRLHASILSFIFDVPCMGIAYQSKVTNLYKSKDKQDFVMDLKGINWQEFEEKLLKTIPNKCKN